MTILDSLVLANAIGKQRNMPASLAHQCDMMTANQESAFFQKKEGYPNYIDLLD